MSKATGTVIIVGGGLSGCEAALALASRGVPVRMSEMKPAARSAAHQHDGLAELVCSNSLRSAALDNAVGLLKEELRLAGSATMRCALASRVAAGGALAVDRERFSSLMTSLVAAAPQIERTCERVGRVPEDRPVVLATGPLTTDELAADLAARVGTDRLAYYDAIAPIVSAESIDWSVAWRQSRYDKGGADYVNCPLEREEYEAFVAAVLEADRLAPRPFEEERYFEGCLPIEVMAARGERTLSFGPLKPVGLIDPRTGRRPFAVVQLRPEDEARTAYNLVGFQTRMHQAEQRRVIRMIPGLEHAELLRLGAVHRNTFIDAPMLLDSTMQLRALPGVYVTGQLAGVEGYVESAAAGLLCGLMLAQRLRGEPIVPPPATTALGGILAQLARRHPRARYQPSNITWAHLPPLAGAAAERRKRDRYRLMAERALGDLAEWLERIGAPPALDPRAHDAGAVREGGKRIVSEGEIE